MPFDTGNLIAIDTHVHIESEAEGNAADQAARKYFGDTGVARGRNELAEYYRSRKIGCVVFSVDERLTGRPQVPNDEGDRVDGRAHFVEDLGNVRDALDVSCLLTQAGQSLGRGTVTRSGGRADVGRSVEDRQNPPPCRFE